MQSGNILNQLRCLEGMQDWSPMFQLATAEKATFVGNIYCDKNVYKNADLEI